MKNWQKILLALILGVICGWLLGEKMEPARYLGIIFFKAIKMVTVPMVFFAIIYGITGLDGQDKIGKLGLKAVVIFMLTGLMAACIGIAATEVLKPGIRLRENGESLTVMLDGLKATSTPQSVANLTDFFMNVVPENPIAAAANGNIFQIVVFSLVCGIFMHLYREEYPTLIQVSSQLALLFFRIISGIMWLAPFGVFGYVSSIVGIHGIEALASLGWLIVSIAIGCVIQYCVFALLLLCVGRLKPWPFFIKTAEMQLLAFTTSSSKAVLVPLMDVLEKKLGVSKSKSRFVLPLAAVLNMDGGAIYQASCAIFFAQLLNIDLSLMQYLVIVIAATIASIGGAGIPSGALLFLGMVFQSIGIPVEAVMIVATVDRFIDMLTTMVNVTGDACVTVIIDKSDNSLDSKKYYA